MPFTDTKVQLSDGANLRVRVLGIDDKEKPLLIALHGAPGLSSHTEPESAYSFLGDRFRVLVYDARGSGLSDLKGPFTDEQWISDVDELRAWAGAETFVLAGGSYGGFLALGYALTHPTRLSSLILRDTWSSGPIGVLRALGAILTSHRITPDPARQVRLWSGNVRDREDCERALAEIVTIYSRERSEESSAAPANFEGASEEFDLHWETHNAAFSFSVPRFDVRSRLSDIKTPTLVLVGRHDPICPVEEAESIHRAIRNSELVVFEASGHNPPADEPDAFQMAVNGFLARLEEDKA
ncbi:Alpha/Beta hydrolase protein [Chaetomium strumarium]|uniref:Alpha/Beta hydrolase protein n=1 Tax=Chaetomium strumarium TaxID=1170767 RepID=A0AAJ0H4L2_9PEZI|nr:Alpha/Beta hydrolase protein [Chaetomium strumarium]